MAHHERIACSVCKRDTCMCRCVSRGPHYPYVCEDCVRPVPLSQLIDAKRKEIEATGLCQWGYRTPEDV